MAPPSCTIVLQVLVTQKLYFGNCSTLPPSPRPFSVQKRQSGSLGLVNFLVGLLDCSPQYEVYWGEF